MENNSNAIKDTCLYFWGFACIQLHGFFGLLTQIATFIAIISTILETIKRIKRMDREDK
jgi:hypothetical protein